MPRTHVYISEEQTKALKAMASRSGKSQSELIRLAVDRLIGEHDVDQRQAAFRDTAGLWKDRDDLPDFTALRQERNRGKRAAPVP
jgi:Arc/MetJ-type ribon-helix-helix transcriptional regulator